MNTIPSTNEIVESTEEIYSESKFDEKAGRHRARKSGNKYIEDDINRLFESIEIRTPSRGFGQSREGSKDAYRKSALKRPIRAGSSQVSGIGISENVSLKQALRGLCISQASEMAAMKRLSKPVASPGVSEAGTIKRLFRTVVVEANGSGIPSNEDKPNFVEISLVPEKTTMDSSKSEISKADLSDQSAHPLTSADATTQGTLMTRLQSQVLLPTDDGSEILTAEVNKLKLVNPSSSHTSERVQVVGALAPTSVVVPIKNPNSDRGQKDKLHPTCSLSSCSISGVSKPSTSSPCSIKPVFRSKKIVKKKESLDSTSASSSTATCNRKVDKDSGHSASNLDSQKHPKTERKEISKASPVSSSTNLKTVVKSRIMDTGSSKQVLSSNCNNSIRSAVAKGDQKSRSREKGELSQSSKSSIGDYSSGTSISEESSLSGSSRSGNRPHMSKDLRWEAIHHVQKQHGSIGIRHFKLLKKLGCGDIGTVYLAELTGTHCLFALKVMDNEFLVSRKKLPRAQTEREIMQMLDHPFLPTLYTHFTTDKLSCLVMEYCPGGDLHVLRQKQPCRSFSEHATRFYVAEVLLALEYLHMLGVVYRDLKPENILVREDGHIMLTDFDLSLKCGAVNPTLLKSASPVEDTTEKMSSPCTEASCIQPFCLQPSWQVPCFTPRLLSVAGKSRKMKSDLASQVSPLPQLVVEPTSARSNSFVGTHEYLAPEIIKSEGHGNAVDWWTLGIFLFELLYGKTPFKGSANDDTLANVVSRSLKFPSTPIVSFHARDLIRGLLIKEPSSRLGSVKGAAEIKQHPFFEGLNWALIRCAVPPELPKFCDVGIGAPVTSSMKKVGTKFREFESTEEKVEFELF